jgi:hypothetical protein
MPQQRHGTVATLHIGPVNKQAEWPTIGIDHRVTLAAKDLLARIITAGAAAFCRFSGWLSITAAEGHAFRTRRSRSGMTSPWLIRANRPSSRQSRNQRHSVDHGGRSEGISRDSRSAGRRRALDDLAHRTNATLVARIGLVAADTARSPATRH